MKDLIITLMALMTILGGIYGTGSAGANALRWAHDRLKMEVLTKLREPRPSLVDFTRKLTGIPPFERGGSLFVTRGTTCCL